jgi:hypothetical protein
MSRRHLRDDERDERFRAEATLVWRDEDGRRSNPMIRIVMMVMMCAALAMPVVASADDQTIPPEAHWIPTPPARSTVEVSQLASLLVDKGIITAHEAIQLTHPQASSPSQPSRARAWTWDDIHHNPVRSTGGD